MMIIRRSSTPKTEYDLKAIMYLTMAHIIDTVDT